MLTEIGKELTLKNGCSLISKALRFPAPKRLLGSITNKRTIRSVKAGEIPSDINGPQARIWL
jgi:hypothetical protein